MRHLFFVLLSLGCTTLTREEPKVSVRALPTSASAALDAVPCLSEFDFNMDSAMDGRTTYQYNAQNQLTQEDFLSLGHGALPSTTLYEYDAAGHLIDRRLIIQERAYVRWSWRYDGAKLLQEEKIMLVPACAQGPVVDRKYTTVYLPSESPNEPIRAEEYENQYDLCNAGDGWVMARTSYRYKDGASTPYQKQYEEPTDNKPYSAHNIELSYDTEGRLLKELYTASNASKGYAEVRYSYEESPPTKTIQYDWQLDGVFEYRTVFSFDKAGKILQEERFEGETSRWVNTTTYNALGQKIKVEVDGSGTAPRDGKADHRTLYQYQCSPLTKR
jgi:hypothetical protein